LKKNIPDNVAAAINLYPPHLRDDLLACRRLIFKAAEVHTEIGPVTETLKWGQPSYLTEVTRAGSTLRLAPSGDGRHAALYVNCNTNLIEQFRQFYPTRFDFHGAREVALQGPVSQVTEELTHCIALTLTYHFRKRLGQKQR